MIITFAFTFYILLLPKNKYSFEEPEFNDDINNPWNMTSIYKVLFNNGTSDPNQFIIKKPDENTNMFSNYGTALFATFLLFIGIICFFLNLVFIDNN